MKITMKHTLAFAMTACLTLNSLPPAQALATSSARFVSTPTVTSITVNKIKFEVVKDADLPKDIANQLDQLKLKRGYKAFPVDGGYLLFVGSGEKTSGGYSIEVLSIEDNEGKTNIQVKETAPNPGDMTTSVMTYPYVVVRMTGVTDNFNLKNEAGLSFESLGTTTVQKPIIKKVTIKRSTGTYIGKIDNNSIEIKVSGKPVALQLGKRKMTIDGMKLKKNTKINFSWQTNEKGQNLLLSLKIVK